MARGCGTLNDWCSNLGGRFLLTGRAGCVRAGLQHSAGTKLSADHRLDSRVLCSREGQAKQFTKVLSLGLLMPVISPLVQNGDQQGDCQVSYGAGHSQTLGAAACVCAPSQHQILERTEHQHSRPASF